MSGGAGWRPDPFGRHEARFFDGSVWTPYVKDGDEHALDEPIEGVAPGALGGPPILTERVLVVEHGVEGAPPLGTCAIFASDGRRLGTVRGASASGQRLEVVDADGTRVLSLAEGSGRKRSVVVTGPLGSDVGRFVQHNRMGMTTYVMESSGGAELGAVRARTWAGWDIRIEDESARTLARVAKTWEGLDRSEFAVPEAYVVRVEHETPDPLRTLTIAAALSIEAMFRRDARG